MKRSRSAPPQRVWQRMLSGRRLDLADPSPMDIEIEDIAHGLARVARWNGQTKGAYAFSVAQHSVLVEDLCGRVSPNLSPNHRMTALLHDAPEYVIGDMISPFKGLLGNDYKDVEARLQEAIHIRFGLPAIIPASLKKTIKRADYISAWFEATQLAGFETGEASKLFGDVPNDITLQITPLPADEAQLLFQTRYNEISSTIEREVKT